MNKLKGKKFINECGIIINIKTIVAKNLIEKILCRGRLSKTKKRKEKVYKYKRDTHCDQRVSGGERVGRVAKIKRLFKGVLAPSYIKDKIFINTKLLVGGN